MDNLYISSSVPLQVEIPSWTICLNENAQKVKKKKAQEVDWEIAEYFWSLGVHYASIRTLW